MNDDLSPLTRSSTRRSTTGSASPPGEARWATPSTTARVAQAKQTARGGSDPSPGSGPSRAVLPCLAAAVVALVVAGTAVAAATQRTAIHTVDAIDAGGTSRWSPDNLTIATGDTVRWTYDAGDAAAPARGRRATAATYQPPGSTDATSVTFPTRGHVHYVCPIHEGTMRGTLTVTARADADADARRRRPRPRRRRPRRPRRRRHRPRRRRPRRPRPRHRPRRRRRPRRRPRRPPRRRRRLPPHRPHRRRPRPPRPTPRGRRSAAPRSSGGRAPCARASGSARRPA